MSTQLVSSLTSQIIAHIRAQGLGVGDRLAERRLAEIFNVSRSPVRDALRQLEEQGLVAVAEGGGFTVKANIADLPGASFSAPEDENLYLTIARDYLAGRLPERVTENELMRRYNQTRPRTVAALRRILAEGWVLRLPGHGWSFLPVLQSEESYEQSFRFRIINEPAAILEPTFRLNEAEILKCRAQQETLLAGDVLTASPAYLFDVNSQLHEVVAECSGNVFIIDALKRINRIRRLIEYGKVDNRASAQKFCREHIMILDLLLEDRRQEASDALRLHLGLVSRRKVDNQSPA
ncbi:GntR family transcriptional regulator [Agrobacterium tumefaciens]|uniref:GntR family transcriptional regulator n=1 Tax=Agrobacterium tumefaciens TaxID=358 RepID=UPI001BA91FC2